LIPQFLSITVDYTIPREEPATRKISKILPSPEIPSSNLEFAMRIPLWYNELRQPQIPIMNSSDHDPASNQDTSKELSETFIEDFVRQLQDGGPEVSAKVIMAFIEEQLPPEKMSAVNALVHTYKNWHDMYVVLFHDTLDDELDEHSADETPIPDTIRKLIQNLIERENEE